MGLRSPAAAPPTPPATLRRSTRKRKSPVTIYSGSSSSDSVQIVGDIDITVLANLALPLGQRPADLGDIALDPRLPAHDALSTPCSVGNQLPCIHLLSS